MYQYASSDIIEHFILSNFDSIKYFSNKHKVSYKALEIQTRLHLPFYNLNDIEQKPYLLIEQISNKLNNYLACYSFYNRKLNKKYSSLLNAKVKGKKDIYLETYIHEKIPLYFKKIENKVIDKIFQKKLHYIKKYRDDTYHSFGLFANKNDKYPLCYASISKCDRIYLLNSLKETNIISEDFDKQVLIMTRAFSIENALKI